jgi:hypothetical protein
MNVQEKKAKISEFQSFFYETYVEELVFLTRYHGEIL